MDESFVEQYVVAIAPRVLLAVNHDAAVVRIGRDQAEVVALRTGERISVFIQNAVRLQHGEHRRFHRRRLPQQGHRAWATLPGGWQIATVPLEIKARPALAEERVEREIIGRVGCPDLARCRAPSRSNDAETAGAAGAGPDHGNERRWLNK